MTLTPNPAADEVWIGFAAEWQGCLQAMVQIADLNGTEKIRLNFERSDLQQGIRVELSALPAGVYWVTCSAEGSVTSNSRLVVVR